MTVLDMSGQIDDVFTSHVGMRVTDTGGRVEGKWVDSLSDSEPFNVTVQSASDREIQTLVSGGERVVDLRRVYPAEGDITSHQRGQLWTFSGIDGTFRVVALDVRPWRNYCKLLVSRNDP